MGGGKEGYPMRIWDWLCGSNPQGVGTLLVGIAALIALYQTSSVLDRILQVQEQAKEIGSAVKELKIQSQQIASAIDLLGSQLKELKATQTVNSSPALQNPSPTKEQIKEAIKSLSTEPSTKRSTIYLPPDKIDETVEMIYKERTPEERAAVLQNSLEYKASGALVNESGNRLTTEEGMGLGIEQKSPPKKK